MAEKDVKKSTDFLNVDETETSSEWAKKVVDGAVGEKPSSAKSAAAPQTPESSQDNITIDVDPGASSPADKKVSEEVAAETEVEEVQESIEQSAEAEESLDIAMLQTLEAEKNQYLETSRRVQAEFENYRKQVAKREVESRERANEKLVTEILPVIDACDGAITNGSADVAPVRSALVDTLVKQGLETVESAGGPFDPELHEAVMHEEAKDSDGSVVTEVLRVGYKWKGRLIRPAMVKVRG